MKPLSQTTQTNQHPHLTDQILDLDALLRETEDSACGALIVFGGTVRLDQPENPVTAIDYTAYAPLAIATLAQLETEALLQFPIKHCRVVHRTGLLALGELSVLIVVRSAHRPAAFDAARWVIETLKVRVPVWKQECYEDGSREYLDGAALV